MPNMLRKIKSLVLSIAFSFVGLGLLPGASLAAVDCSSGNLTSQQAIQCGVDAGSGNNTQTPAQASQSINDTLASILQVLSAAAGIAAVIMLIIGGVRYVTSGGKQESVTSAKNTILYAVIGLVIVAVAQLIVHFVLHKVT